MFLIVGLGNPGLAYAYTRHNVGFLFTDYFAYDLGFPEFKNKFNSLYSEKNINDNKIIIQKPQTFMNLSGESVSQIASFYKIKTENIFVVHDDIDLNPLEIKIKFAGGSGGHNGIRSIDKHIGNEYWRIRIGVGRPLEKEQVANYVLSKFYNNEINDIFPKVFLYLTKNLPDLILSDDRKTFASKIIKKINDN